MDLEIYGTDGMSRFLNDELEKDIYMHQPKIFVKGGSQ